jgi:hypothetical protein
MTNVLKKLAFPLVVCGVLGAGSMIQAQTPGDIVSISSDQENTVFTTSGDQVEVKIRVFGDFRTRSIGGTALLYPQLRMNVNGAIGYANFISFNRSGVAGNYRTDLLFRYGIKPGDMAAPLTIFGTAGAGASGDGYQIYPNGWEIYNQDTSSNVVWRFNVGMMGTGDKLDLNFAGANVTLKTLAFNNVPSVDGYSVAASENTTVQATAQRAVEGADVAFYLWVANTNIVKAVSAPGQPFSIPVGQVTCNFQITGLATGTTQIALQRVSDYNPKATVATNASYSATVTVTAPPEPTVSVLFSGASTTTLDESQSGPNTGSLTVQLSQPFAQSMVVRLDTPAGQNNISVPATVTVPAGSTSAQASFSLLDGTPQSLLSGVVVSPVVITPVASNQYTRLMSGTVRVRNVKPEILQPLGSYAPTVTRGDLSEFKWMVNDVTNDLYASKTLVWNFGDGTPEVTVGSSDATGSVTHVFSTPATGTGTKTVTFTVTDKDGTTSDQRAFTVTVIQPVPKPSLRIIPSADAYAENSTNNTGALNLVLSESFNEDVWVRLTTSPAGQNNIVFSSTNAIRIASGSLTNATAIKFSIPDGTLESEAAGIDVIPAITNAAALSYYKDVSPITLYAVNVRPRITYPLAADLAAAPLAPFNSVPMGVPFAFNWIVADVPADLPAMVMTWDFGDGIIQAVTGLASSVSHTYTSLGDKIVRVKAVDKDLGESDVIQFKVTVVAPPPPPTVTVTSPAGMLDEGLTTGEFTVLLSEAFTNDVTVLLTVSPGNDAVNGTITLSTNRVVIPAGRLEPISTVKVNAKDGTVVSRDTSFNVAPTVLATPKAVEKYAQLIPNVIRVVNVAPVFSTPLASSTTGASTYTIPQGTPWVYYWDLYDVALDLPSMSVTWYFGDGKTAVRTGGSGNVTNTYTTVGDMIVRVVAVDKDGGRAEVQFKVTVAPAKAVNVTPLGPNLEANYWGASGLGNGTVTSPEARSSANYNNVYFFKYDPGVSSATLLAVPYKAGSTGYTPRTYDANGAMEALNPARFTLYDSFFYVWVGTDQGLAAQNLVPATAGPTVVVTLPASTGTAGSTTSVDIRDLQAIFSREYRIADNMGDINLDGIPDKIATRYNLPTLASGGSGTGGTSGGTGGTPIELINVASYNADNDFLPGAASGGGAIIGGISNVFATIGDPFTAFLEVRGFHPGLNNAQYGSDADFGPGETKGDEPRVGDQQGTDPTKIDTDGDGFPDGWEYYFWYNARMKYLTGSKYDPLNVSVGTVIDYNDIIVAFNPLVPATDTGSGAAINRDLDNDGLSDIEELAMGTNPINWDTDGDGMCDGWEVLRGLNPNDSRDAFSSSMNNPDGDYMAYAYVSELKGSALQFVTAVRGITTNTYLATGVSAGTNTGAFTTWYQYGDTNALLAVGRPVTLAAGEYVTTAMPTNALILHNQVYQEFGFDPRVAWAGTVNPLLHPQRFPAWVAGYTAEGVVTAPNTKPFTSVDEYLLLKYMSALRLNGATASMGAGNAAQKTSDWTSFSTHPKTPDSDVVWGPNGTVAKSDRMPDGWELYVSAPKDWDRSELWISPWDPTDGDWTIVGEDDLSNVREFHGTDSTGAYTNTAQYGAAYQVVTIKRPDSDTAWVNKFWPTDPWIGDTDGDGMRDNAEMTFIYGTPADNGSACIPGGGLNPCSMDTDLDGLTDTWENQFAGTMPAAAPFSMTNGMDGTVSDFSQDWDHDGLLNYQEYWVQAVRSLRYDIPDAGVTAGPKTGNPGLPMDATFGVSSLFTEITNAWDCARKPWGENNPTLWVLLPVGPARRYVSTDPRAFDSDFDGMDDYYEMFHGLNPILGDTSFVNGDRIKEAYVRNGAYTIDYGSGFPLGNDWGGTATPLLMDFVSYPWLTGLDWADPDADGLLNLEEQLQADTAAPSCSNTDPTPLWMTDVYNPNSVTARFYWFGGMFFWPGTAVNSMPSDYNMFSFEMNEGFDTDNDGVSDKAELLQTATTQSDPQDHDDPMRRQALWFSGANSVAETFDAYSYNEWTFRSFTVELWARPESVSREQVLIERPILYTASDLTVTGNVVRVNFRVGIAGDGRVYAMFQNAGVHDAQTGVVMAYGRVLAANEWVHLSARMNGATGMFDLLLNGRVETSVPTMLSPANGVINVLTDPAMGQYPFPYSVTLTPGALVLGASKIKTTPLSPPAWIDYKDYYQGSLDEVRVWDGARSNDEILSSYNKRFSKADLLQNRRAVRESEFLGGSRVTGISAQLPPELMYHYTFDNLFSADSTDAVAQVPRGFNHPEVSINRPAGSVFAPWFAMATHSTVYADYGYVPWIENGVEHLPIFGGVVRDGSNVVSRDSNTVLDSIYWSHYMAGVTPPSAHNLSKYQFPNNNNPYGLWYRSSLDFASLNGAGTVVASDLLPLGGAWAKQMTVMWDNSGASGVWAETGSDSDADGLPDWWETYAANAGYGAGLGWYSLLADGSGMTAGERYMRDIANGYTLGNHPLMNLEVPPGVFDPTRLVKQTSDVDGDGLPDWWENLYNLNPYDATGVNGALGDQDFDGLSNYAEYLISERYNATATGGAFNFPLSRPNKFRTLATQAESDYFRKVGSLYLGEMFSDHDFMEDSWEDAFDPYYVNRFAYDPQRDNDQDGWSNWAESRYGASALRSDPSLGMHLNPEADSVKDFPVPVIETHLTYNGLRPIGNLIVYAYSKPSMDAVPDAIFRVQTVGSGITTSEKNLGYWGPKTVKGFLSPGTIVPGSLTISFIDPVSNAGLYAIQAGRDVGDASGLTGVIKGFTGAGLEVAIGTINYVTGEYQIDMSWYSGVLLAEVLSPTLVVTANPENSYIKIGYQSSLITGWPKTLYLSDPEVPTAARLSSGYIREGTNYFFGVIDLNNNGAWDAGEPCGVSEGFGVDIGWDHNVVKIELTDYLPTYVRMTLNPAVRSEDVLFGGAATTGSGTTTTSSQETRIRIQRRLINGGVANNLRFALDKTLQVPRTFIHDGDLLETGVLGLDWGFVGEATPGNIASATYQVFRNSDLVTPILSFTNTFDAVRAKAVSTAPVNGAYVYSARPTFKWKMPEGYTAFTLEIRKGSSSGTVVYNSGTVKAPLRDSYGNCVWTAPITAGDRIPSTGQIFLSNTVYAWRVIAQNAKFFDTTGVLWSDSKLFRLDVNQPLSSSGYGAVQARVKYYGPATNLSNRVKVQAFHNRGFTGVPEAQYTLSTNDVTAMLTPGSTNLNAVLRGLAKSSVAGDYYLRAFIDHNTNGVRDAWESWGYANYYGVNDKPYDVYPVTVEYKPVTQVYEINIEDADTDQDWYPDAWEYEINPNTLSNDFLNLTGPWGVAKPNAEVNPFLYLGTNDVVGASSQTWYTMLSLGVSDADGDGLSDMAELILGSNPTAASTAGDGFADGAKLSLGLSPYDTLTFNVTGLSLTDAAATLRWNLNVQKATALSQSLLTTDAAAGTSYEIQYKASLNDTQWTTVVTGVTALDGVQPDKINQVGLGQIDVKQGFFRILLQNP